MNIADSIALAKSHHQAGRLPEAERLYQEVLSRAPEEPDALHLLGVVALQRGQFDAAAAYIRQALSFKADFAQAHNNLGVALKSDGKFEQAIVAFDAAVSSDAGFADAHFNRGTVLQAGRRLEEAIAAYEHALELEPDLADAWINLGSVYKAMGRWDRSASAFERLIELRPEWDLAHFNLGAAKKQAGALAEAAESLQRSTELNPEFGEALYNLAVVRMELGQAGAALTAADAYLRGDPGSTRALAVRAVALNELQQRDALEKLLGFDRYVRTVQFESVPGYPSLDAFHSELERHVCAHPSLAVDPEGHATRMGSHSGNLLVEPKGPIETLENMITTAVQEYITALDPDLSHPFVTEPPSRLGLTVWGIVLQAQGHQVPHMHPSAWLSGVYYVKVPKVVDGPDGEHAGWLEFGRPDLKYPTSVEPMVLPMRPQAGLLVMFPSYLYHRTIPFQTSETRISIAFDASRDSDRDRGRASSPGLMRNPG